MDNNTVSICCLLNGQSLDDAFIVSDKCINDLKASIKEMKLANIDADNLSLYQVFIPNEDEETLKKKPTET
jgi:Crinkler effector protein N-terminal domain